MATGLSSAGRVEAAGGDTEQGPAAWDVCTGEGTRLETQVSFDKILIVPQKITSDFHHQ